MGDDLLVRLLRRLGLVVVFAAFPAWSGIASNPTDPNEWTPDAQTISHIDALALKLELPKEFGSIGDYSRFYYGTMHAGRKVIIGTFVSPQVQKAEHRRVTSGIHIVPESMPIGIADGGCMQVNLEYDVQSQNVESRCNFELPVPPLPPPENSN